MLESVYFFTGGNKTMAARSTPAPPAPTLAMPMKDENDWRTLDAPELFSFEKPGQEIEGVLLSAGKISLREKMVVQYVLQTPQQKIVKLLGTYDLVQKLTARHIGWKVRIRYRGEDPEIKKGDNHMKIFHVQVKEPPSDYAPQTGPITDEDIPF